MAVRRVFQSRRAEPRLSDKPPTDAEYAMAVLDWRSYGHDAPIARLRQSAASHFSRICGQY